MPSARHSRCGLGLFSVLKNACIFERRAAQVRYRSPAGIFRRAFFGGGQKKLKAGGSEDAETLLRTFSLWTGALRERETETAQKGEEVMKNGGVEMNMVKNGGGPGQNK